MSTNREKDLLRVTAAIADGDSVDWVSLSNSLEPDLIARLQDLQALAGHFEQSPSAEDAATPTSSAQHWGHLRLDGELGRGASGVVHRAYDAVLKRHVALKLCATGKLDHAALLREAEMMARVDHPNVLKVHGAAEREGVVGLWSDLLEGESLSVWAKSHPRLSAGELVALGLELCTALAALHAAGLVHGDLKTSNVMRHPAGRWVLVDFGSSARVADDLPSSSGTPLYLAPELFDGASVSAQSDLYSLGVLLFRMASGRHPVEAADVEKLRALHTGGERLRLLDLRPDLPAALLDTIERAMATQPERRFASAGAMADALRGVLVQPQAQLARQRRPWLLATLAASALALLVTVALRPTAPLPELELQLIKTNAGGHSLLRDGDAVAPGDALALEYRNPESAHVYVINEDAEGAVFQLFPLAGAEWVNPLPAGQTLRLPGRIAGRDVDWQITSRGQRERFYILVAASPLPELEAQMFAAAELGRPIDRADLLAAGDADAMRGAGGLVARPAAMPGTQTSEWINKLRERHPDVEVKRFELSNP